jgi:SAM-dependent methyltransferase
LLLNNLDQARELLATLEPGCGDQKQAKYRAALDYSREMYAKGGERYLQHVEKIGFTGGRVLDVGCGAGHWCLALAQHNHEVVGLDANSEYIDIARLVAANFANGQRLHLFTGVAEELPYPDGHFDYLVCHGVLMFTEHELALSEFRRILKPDGKLYLGYSGLGWYLRYLLEDGIANGNEARLRKGAAVLSASFKFAAGFRSVGELWLSLPPAILNELVEATGFKINGHPGIQDIKMDGFLGLEAPYDLLATAGATEQTERGQRYNS